MSNCYQSVRSHNLTSQPGNGCLSDTFHSPHSGSSSNTNTNSPVGVFPAAATPVWDVHAMRGPGLKCGISISGHIEMSGLSSRKP